MGPENQRAVLVTGSRDWVDSEAVTDALREADPRLVIHGGCPDGADAIASCWVSLVNDSTSTVAEWRIEAPWALWGKAAGPKRNGYLVACARSLAREGVDVVVLAFPMPSSRGTWDCAEKARRAGLTVRVIRGEQ